MAPINPKGSETPQYVISRISILGTGILVLGRCLRVDLSTWTSRARYRRGEHLEGRSAACNPNVYPGPRMSLFSCVVHYNPYADTQIIPKKELP